MPLLENGDGELHLKDRVDNYDFKALLGRPNEVELDGRI